MPMRNPSLFHVVLPLSIALASAALGCGGTAASEHVATADSAATRAPVGQNTHGAVKLAGDALGEVSLTASQRADVEKLAADAETRHTEARGARKEMLLAIAAQVEGGSIDRAALRPKIDALVALANASQPADRAAFERLHAILGPDQRVSFVHALEARVFEHAWNGHGKHPWKQWAEDLNLSDEQRAKIKAALEPKWHGGRDGRPGEHMGEARQRGAKLFDAFKQDRFSIDEVVPAQNMAHVAAKASEHFLAVAETVLPLLTPEQRAIAAQKLRARADDAESAEPMMP